MLNDEYECLVFHATGVGGQSMEKLMESGLLSEVIDVTTTEVCDLLLGGVMPATEDRFGSMIRARMPYVGSCGALDMVNFGAPETVPARYQGRTLYRHNPEVTLMRTTVEENDRIGNWIGERLNLMDAPVRFFLPEGGVSALDAPGARFTTRLRMPRCFQPWNERCGRPRPASSSACRSTSTIRSSLPPSHRRSEPCMVTRGQRRRAVR